MSISRRNMLLGSVAAAAFAGALPGATKPARHADIISNPRAWSLEGEATRTLSFYAKRISDSPNQFAVTIDGGKTWHYGPLPGSAFVHHSVTSIGFSPRRLSNAQMAALTA